MNRIASASRPRQAAGFSGLKTKQGLLFPLDALDRSSEDLGSSAGPNAASAVQTSRLSPSDVVYDYPADGSYN